MGMINFFELQICFLLLFYLLRMKNLLILFQIF